MSTFSLKNDAWITRQSITPPAGRAPLITPLQRDKVRKIELADSIFPVVSYGQTSYGYDLTLSPNDFRLFHHVPGDVMDPLDFYPEFLEQATLHESCPYQCFILPAHSYALGVVAEHITMPANCLGICIGKSTYARLGIQLNMTPVEPGWSGHLTLEMGNNSGADCRIYANQGICQIIFLEGEPCDTPYGSGKYQGQSHEVTTARA